MTSSEAYDESSSSPVEKSDVTGPHSSEPFLLFVYGTLKHGGSRHGPLAEQRYRGQARTRPLYALYHLGGYPGLALCPRAGRVVQGELYEVDRSLLGWLDRVEGAPYLFALAEVELEGVAGPTWAYFYQRDPSKLPRIESGTWEVGEEQR
jgi:gamma-glutamylcyclotransferase (GGCT)/AIG2-like uncharacterized protein YtfP